jgi:O-acetyl-ADP-ribose deacetylase (regulator of RNase III)
MLGRSAVTDSPADDRSETLRSCYLRSLQVADELGAASVAFPLVSSGIYGWPVDDALHQAITVLRGATCDARLVLFDEPTMRAARRVVG